MVISAQRYLPVAIGGKNRALTYKSNLDVSGYAALPHDLTINGVTKSPTFRYEGGSATPTLWTATVGNNLAVAGSGDAPVIDEYAPGLTDSRVDFSEGKSFAGSTISTTTEDIAFEAIVKVKSLSSTYSILTNVSSAPGIQFYHSTTASVLTMYIRDSTPTVLTFNTPTLSIGKYYHLICFIDKSGSGIWYANGVAGTAVVVSSVGSVASVLPLTVGAGVGGASSQANVSVSYLSMWQGAGWLDTHLQAAVAKERFHLACGIYPQLAKGTAAPSVATRSTVAYVDKLDSSGNRLLVPVGAEWMRVCEREDSNGDTLAGYLPEIQSTNSFTYSEDFSNAAWVKTRSSVNSNVAVAPDGTLTADGLAGEATSNTHFIAQSLSAGAADDQFSVWLKSGAKTWAYMDAPSVAGADCYFDLGNCALGTSGAGASGVIEDWGNGWCRCTLVYTAGVPAHDHVIAAADADEDHTYTGDGSTSDIFMWGAQHEQNGLGIPTSYMKTTAAAFTRTKDQLQAVAGANIGGEDVGKGTMECSVLIPNYNNAAVLSVLSLSDGGSAADSIVMSVNTSDLCAVDSAASGGNAGASTALGDVSTNVVTVLKAKYNTNSLTAAKDNVADTTPDTECDMPDDIDEIDIGQSIASATQPGGLIGKIKIYKKPV